MVTGGPTRAYLDDVRFLSNYSTGELAWHICAELQAKGYRVIAITGPNPQPFAELKLHRWVRVETNRQMFDAALKFAERKSVVAGIFAAAVLDFEPRQKRTGKVSSKGNWNISLRPAPKIVDAVGKSRPDMVRVGFKLESKIRNFSQDSFAQKYRKSKNFDLLCLNYLSSIKRSSHPAFLFTEKGLWKTPRTKKEVAKNIVKFLGLRLIG